MVHTRPFGSLRSCRRTQKTKTQSLSPFVFWSFGATVTAQKAESEPGFSFTLSKSLRDLSS